MSLRISIDKAKTKDWKWSYRRPYLLDTEDKVKWANERLIKGYPYRIGDHCPIVPVIDGDQHG